MIAFSGGGLVARRWRSFENLFCLAEVDSSNKLAREFMELYFEEDQKLPPTVILAAAQSQARGRKGDRWHAPAGRGLYFTFVRPAGPGEPVTQEIALSVKDNKVECIINGTVVATYDKALLVVQGKLKSTDGIYGIRFAHNTEALVTSLTMTNP